MLQSFPPTPRARRNGFSLLELMLSIVIVALLAGFLYTGMQQTRRRADQLGCTANLKQISAASAAYSVDHGGEWPENRIDKENGNVIFMESLLPYIGPVPKHPAPNFRASPFVCPAERLNQPGSTSVYIVRSRGLSYGQNAFLQATTSTKKVGPRIAVQYPSELVLYMDFQGHYLMDFDRLLQSDRIAQIKKRHGPFANAAFADGSVRPVDIDAIPTYAPSRFWQGRDQ